MQPTTLPEMRASEIYTVSLNKSLFECVVTALFLSEPNVDASPYSPNVLLAHGDDEAFWTVAHVEAAPELDPEALIVTAFGDSIIWHYVDVELVLAEIGEHWEGE